MSKNLSTFFLFPGVLLWISGLVLNLGSCEEEFSCHPAPRLDTEHYIIGYGSLMEKTSRLRTCNGTEESIPVQVHGFRREWNIKGEHIKATVLGVVVNASFSINSVIFKLPPSPQNPNSITAAMELYDKRETHYCRQKVDVKNIRTFRNRRSLNNNNNNTNNKVQSLEKASSFLDQNSTKSEYWIYVNKPESIQAPSTSYPIVQSYVDVFISGCLELEEQYNLRNFARKCVTSTKRWSKTFSVNDRLSPRYPTVHCYSPAKIDAIIGGLGQNQSQTH